MSQETLYHYCSSHAFLEIIKNGKLWISSMKSSNDYYEGSWMSRVIEYNGFKSRFEGNIKRILSKYLLTCYDDFSALALCLSEEGDLLSQWRGYADDGHGFCIGFSRELLEYAADKGECTLNRIQYLSDNSLDDIDSDIINEHLEDAAKWISRTEMLNHFTDEEILEILLDAKSTGIPSIDENIDSIMESFIDLSNNIFTFKNKAFSEEKEWRILQPVYSSEGMLYRSSRDRIIPYKEIDIAQIPGIVVDIVMGPKNISDISAINGLWFDSRFGKNLDQVVRKSSASYR